MCTYNINSLFEQYICEYLRMYTYAYMRACTRRAVIKNAYCEFVEPSEAFPKPRSPIAFVSQRCMQWRRLVYRAHGSAEELWGRDDSTAQGRRTRQNPPAVGDP